MNKEHLTPQQNQILYKGGTEPPFSGEYWDFHKDGIYYCRGCHTPLFSSQAKFDSGTGWPSFSQPLFDSNVELLRDKSFGLERVEARCKNCHGHLGHVFDDGPKHTQRWCMNSASLLFKE